MRFVRYFLSLDIQPELSFRHRHKPSSRLGEDSCKIYFLTGTASNLGVASGSVVAVELAVAAEPAVVEPAVEVVQVELPVAAVGLVELPVVAVAYCPAGPWQSEPVFLAGSFSGKSVQFRTASRCYILAV